MEGPTHRRPGPGWKFWLRLGVSAGLLVVLIINVPDLGGIVPHRHHLRTALLLGAAVIVTFIGVVLSAWRWQRVLAVFDVDVPVRTLTFYYLAGLFVGNVLPSTIGGDVLRVARVSNDTGSTTTAFASVALERLTGFVALPLLVFVGFAIRPSLLDADHAWVALLVASITLAALSLILFLAGHPRLAGRFAGNTNWTRFIGAIHLGVDNLRHRPRQALSVLLTAVIYQGSVVAAVALIFRTLDLPVPLAAACSYVATVAMVQVLPLSFNGLGVREGMLVYLLHPIGVSEGQAIAAGLLWFTSMLVVSMFGAPAFASGSRSRRRRETVTAESAM
ncbi:MAG: glycosyltransferase 2 family protein [Actinomycetota bacterium]|nr:glycosyltransferase 2 family protein [Actinomycetota bacterium]